MGRRNYLVEGVSGTGKTSVADELRRRGYQVIHGDRELAYQGDPVTGEPVAGHTHEHHLWSVPRVRALVADQTAQATFYCGGSRNFAAFLDLFDGVFVLEVDPDTLRRRLDQRPEDEWGGKPAERRLVEQLHASGSDTPNGIAIDATAPLSRVVDQILDLTASERDDVVSVQPWFAQPDEPLGTVILLPGGTGGVATPLLHWPATLLTQAGWSVLGITWDEGRLQRNGAAAEVRRCAEAAHEQVPPGQPVLVVAKSLGTLALPWAVELHLPGVWLTPQLGDSAVVTAVAAARQPTLLVGGTGDPHWQPGAAGPGVTLMELPDADHGLQRPGDWRRSVLDQVEIFDRVSHLADEILNTTPPDRPPATGHR